MGSLRKTFKMALKGNKPIYFASFFFQFLMTLLTVFTVFMTKVLVDALSHDLEKAEYIEGFVLNLISLGRGADYVYDHLLVLPIAVVVSALLTAGISYVRFYLRVKASTKINKRLQLLLFEHLEHLPYPYFKTEKSGDLIQTCTRDIDLTRQLFVMDMSQLTYTFFVVVLCFSVLLEISWKLGLMSLCTFPFLFVYSFFLIKEVRRRFRKTDDAEADMVDRISQNLDGARLVKAFNGQRREVAKFEEKLTAYSRAYRREKRLGSFFYGSSDIFIFAARTIALIYSIYLVYQGEITPGTVVVAFTFVNMMVWPLRNTATTLSRLGQTLAATDRIQKLMGLPVEDLEEGETPQIEGEIEFQHVDFAYPDAPNVPVLRDISFHVKKGQTVAIMGKTGSGKSSLSQLLTRLYPVNAGAVLLDGHNVNDIALGHLRKNVVPVLQDPFLFSKSISENIRIARPDASEEEVHKAAAIASVDSAIESFEDGYETPVGEKGTTLSGGQKQRVAIARTVILGAPILIFDDSLSAVDAATDLRIRKQLKALANQSTVLIITHRINTAKDADLILVLDQGHIAEMGTNEELLKGRGIYRRVYDIQAKLS